MTVASDSESLLHGARSIKILLLEHTSMNKNVIGSAVRGNTGHKLNRSGRYVLFKRSDKYESVDK